MRYEAFRIEDGMLVRAVTPGRGGGEPYEHRCAQVAFEDVAHAVDAMAGAAFTLESLHERINLPWTQIAVALAFLKERGCVVPVHGRRHKAAPGSVHLDSMIEWHALREGAPGA